MIFRNRKDAGSNLAVKLLKYTNQKDVVLIALPRGGIPVAYEIQSQLQLRLSVLIVRKLGAPFNHELAIGAIASGGAMYLDRQMIKTYKLSESIISMLVRDELEELHRREQSYLQGKLPNLSGKTVILVDDGIATGATMMAAVTAVKHLGAKQIVIAVPVCDRMIAKELTKVVDEFICLLQLQNFHAVSEFYLSFPQVSDREVVEYLHESQNRTIST